MLPPYNLYWFRIDNKHITEPWLDQALMKSAYKCVVYTLYIQPMKTFLIFPSKCEIASFTLWSTVKMQFPFFTRLQIVLSTIMLETQWFFYSSFTLKELNNFNSSLRTLVIWLVKREYIDSNYKFWLNCDILSQRTKLFSFYLKPI